MTRAYVGLGSNSEPETNIRAAVRLLASTEQVIAVSTFYRNESLPAGGAPFINGAVALEVSKRPRELKLDVLRGVEAQLGRVRTIDKNAPCTIDCDLLVHGDEVFAPDLETRGFVAIPLLEIAPPDLFVPTSGRKLADIVSRLPRRSMTPLLALTHGIRAELKEAGHGHRARRSARARVAR